jgi:hypothetical protein
MSKERIKMKINVNCDVDVDEFVDMVRSNASHQELEDFIIEFDLSIGDVGFTENIIEKLVNSMVDEYRKSDDSNDNERLKLWNAIAGTIKKIKKIPD